MKCIALLVGFINFVTAVIAIFTFYTTYLSTSVSLYLGKFLPYMGLIRRHSGDILLVSLTVFVVTLFIQQQRRKRSWLDITGLLDEVSMENGEIIRDLSEFIRIYSPQDTALYRSELNSMAERIQTSLVKSLTRVSNLYSIYTGCQCHACIKIYDPQTNAIKTVARDASSFRSRSDIDRMLQNGFLYTENSAFKNIIDDPDIEHFVSNYLKFRMGYVNRHRGWSMYYTATLVVPIAPHSVAVDMSSNSVDMKKNLIWGFLCLDNKSGGFDGGSAVRILKSFARMYYVILANLSQLPPPASR